MAFYNIIKQNWSRLRNIILIFLIILIYYKFENNRYRFLLFNFYIIFNIKLYIKI